MKKILSISMMMLAIMVATFSFASCGSDDDNNGQLYKLEVALTIDEPGNLTTAECQELIMQAASMTTTATHNSDSEAEIATGMAAEAMAHGLERKAAVFGDAIFTYTFKCTKVSNGAQVITYYVGFNDGDVTCYNNKN